MVEYLKISCDVSDYYTFHDVDSPWNACSGLRAHLVTIETTDEWNKVKGSIAEKLKWTGSLDSMKKVEGGNGPRQYLRNFYCGRSYWCHCGTVTVATDESRWQTSETTTHDILKEACCEITSKSGKLYGHINNVRCNTKCRNAKCGYICENY